VKMQMRVAADEAKLSEAQFVAMTGSRED